MSEGAAQNGETQAASAGEAAVAAGAAANATPVAAAASAAGGSAVAAAPTPAAAPAPQPAAHAAHAHVHAPAAAPAAAGAVQAAPAPAPAKGDADCKPKKVAKNEGDKNNEDEDQNLSQPADGCVLPAPDGQAAAPAAPAAEPAPVPVDDGEGGGISSGLLIGAGVLAAIGVGVLALAKDDEEKNTPPVATADTAAVNEGSSITGSVATNDRDDNNDPLTYTLTGTAPAGLTFNNNGSFTFDANNPAYNSLAAGQTQTVTANYSVADGRGGTASSTLTITVTGTNDVPTAVADTNTATEGGAVVTGNVATNDTDADQGQTATLTYTLNAPVPGLTLNSNGTYSFDPTNAAYNGLAAGQTQQVVANVTARDASGGTSTSTLTITVTGTNDAPVAVADTNAGNEDTQITGSVATNDSDPDAGNTLTYTVVGTAPAGFTLNANGTYTLDAGNAAYQGLAQGQVQNVVVNYQVSDGTATATSTLTIAVTGQADAVSLDVDNDNDLNTARAFGAAGAVSFTDDDDVANVAIINGFGADDTITFDAPFNGAGSVSFASGDYDNDGSPDDLRITTNKGGVVSDLILTNVVDPSAVVFSEATAEAAVAGTDNFRTTTQSSAPAAQSLDVDNDSNLTSTFSIAPAANTGTFAYSDDDDIANTVRVVDFGGDDVITFDAAVQNASFASGDFDGDTVADDLRITINKGGVVSDIILTNSVAANAVIFNETQAEAAVGPGFENFVFNGVVAPPPPPPPAGTTAQSLDVDNDANLNTYRSFDASTDGFRYTDDADVANTTQIVNFGTNDRIVFETGNTYSFANQAFQGDGDNLANDLFITINKGGTVSELVIKNAVDPNAVVFSEALAEAALNQALGTTNVDYFSFA